MPDSLDCDREALNRALSALTDLQVNIQLIAEYLEKIQRHANYHDLYFDSDGDFVGMSWKHDPKECYLATSEECFNESSNCEWLRKHIDELADRYFSADRALWMLPDRLLDVMDRLTGTPWLAAVRSHCLDNIMKWPGEAAHQTSYASKKILGTTDELLANAEKHSPFATWEGYIRLLQQYGHDLFAIRHYVLPKPALTDASAERPDREALGEKALAALGVIEREGPVAGKVIAIRINVDEATLRRHYLPALKPFGLRNDRTGDGYYIAQDGKA